MHKKFGVDISIVFELQPLISPVRRKQTENPSHRGALLLKRQRKTIVKRKIFCNVILTITIVTIPNTCCTKCKQKTADALLSKIWVLKRTYEEITILNVQNWKFYIELLFLHFFE